MWAIKDKVITVIVPMVMLFVICESTKWATTNNLGDNRENHSIYFTTYSKNQNYTISQTIDRLLDGYDKRIRPNIGGKVDNLIGFFLRKYKWSIQFKFLLLLN